MVTISPEGMTVHLKEYDFIKVFRIVSKDGDTQYWATDVLDMQEEKRKRLAKKAWEIEEYHRGQTVLWNRTLSGKKKQCAESTYYDGNKSISKI